MKKLLDVANEIRHGARMSLSAKRASVALASRAATAKALVLWGKKGSFSPERVEGLFPKDLPLPSRITLERHSGGASGCLAQVREGGWEPAEGTPWTRDFVHGLELSGAMRRRGDAGAFYVPFPRRRTWLVREIESGLPVACSKGKVLKVSSHVDALVVSGFYLGEMPPSDPCGAGVLAGMLAGSLKVRKADGLWLAMRKSDEAEWVLGRWTVAWATGKGNTKWNDRILVSPFYAAVMRRRMPDRARLWMDGTVKPALCPLLPMAMWQMCFRGEGESWGMPFPGALPWGRGRREAARLGLGLKGLRRAVLERCGITGVGGLLRDEMLAGYELAKADPGSRLTL